MTPFIAFVPLTDDALADVVAVHFTIAAADGTTSRPVDVTYSIDYLDRRGYVDFAGNSIDLPVFGLYSGAVNTVTVQLDYDDGSNSQLPVSVATQPWVDSHGIFDHGTVVRARQPGDALGFDFFYMKTTTGSPVIVDSDGNVRWVTAGVPGTFSSTFTGNGFMIAAPKSLQIYRAELDGAVSMPARLTTPDGKNFSHSVDAGKFGLMGELDVVVGGQKELRSVATEFDADSGREYGEWNIDRIVSDYMTSQGDDPSLFVRPQTDWFHMNMVYYDASDDSMLISSRENFVMKIDYATGAIKWIFGDTTKYWYKFPSLRALALTLAPGGLAPIGQHAVSMAPDGNLLMFNNGTPSFNQPAGQPAGAKRKYSAVTSYAIDEVARTATQVWDFDYGGVLRSKLCGSARQVADGSVLVDYAQAANATSARIVGLDPNHQVIFDLQFANREGCATSWNAQPIGLDQMTFD